MGVYDAVLCGACCNLLGFVLCCAVRCLRAEHVEDRVDISVGRRQGPDAGLLGRRPGLPGHLPKTPKTPSQPNT